MLKNKINILVVMFLFSVVSKNSYAMDRAIVSRERYDQDEPIFSDVFVNVSPLFPSMFAEFRVCVDNHIDAVIAADFTSDYFSRNTGTVLTSLRLVNKEMNEYFKRDDVLHEKTLKIKQHKSAKNVDLGEIRALIEGSKTKRMQHKLLNEAYFINKEKLAAITGLPVEMRHGFDLRYYSDPEKIEKYCCVWGLVKHDGLALVNISKNGTEEFLGLIEPLLRLPGIRERFKDNNGKTGLMLALDNHRTFNQYWFAVKHGIDVGINDQDENGNTAFMLVVKKIAAMGYVADCIRQGSSTEDADTQNLFMQGRLKDLKQMGADHTIRDKAGVMPIDILGNMSLKLADEVVNNYKQHIL